MNLASNYGDVLSQLQEAGLQVDGLVIGQRQRVRVEGDRERRGWYHLHEMPLDNGGALIVGTYGVWRGNDSGTQKVRIAKGQSLSAEQAVALKARIAADRRAAELARKHQVERAAARAQRMWERLDTSGDSEYLRRKGVAPHGVRFSSSGAVVLPLLDAHGAVYGLQAIYPRGHPKVARLGRDKDFWPSGLAKQGHFFLIGSPAAAGICLLAEGYATAASAFEAVGLPVAVAFDAGNIVHVAAALRSRWPRLRILVLADDDYIGKCRACGKLTPTSDPSCAHCGAEGSAANAGILAAQAAALADNTSWLAPRFAAARPTDRKGPTDWNDLHLAEGLHVVRTQIEGHLTALDWRAAAPSASASGGGDAEAAVGAELRSLVSVDELHRRYALVYEAADTVFDFDEHKLVPLASARNLCASRQLHRQWMESPDKRVVRLEEVGFDPAGLDPAVKCNLWAGWPTKPSSDGCCDRLLALGEYLCSHDAGGAAMWQWLLRWLAYPLQHAGAKMKTAVIMHGPQGTGKNLFFEAVLGMYGKYGQVVDQDAVEDKYNDYMSCRLMLVADEVVARMEMFHAKNKLKGLVTSDWIRINPKFVASYRERNHINLVFLSNEVQPMALERDDRRYAVIWTPPKWNAEMYHAVLAEIAAGGVAALHHYLLHLDLGDFGPATLPPMTEAKESLIELGMDSSERFFNEWERRYLPLPLEVARSEDLYQAYRHWCGVQGVAKPAQLNTCLGGWSKRQGVRRARRRHFKHYSQTTAVQSVVIVPPGAEEPSDRQELTDAINRFAEALRSWREEHQSIAGVGRMGGVGAPAAGSEGRAERAARPSRRPGEDDDDAPY